MKLKTLIFLPILLVVLLFSAFLSKNKPVRCKYVPQDMILIQGNEVTGDFYISSHEVTNYEYGLYLKYLKHTCFAYENAIPDTNIMIQHFTASYNDPLLYDYFRYPAYQFYPVTGVNWYQACDYCQWKTDRLNKHILIEEEFFEFDTNVFCSDDFTTESFYANKFLGLFGENYSQFEQEYCNEEGLIKEEAQVLFPAMRLPTEYEWITAYTYLSNNKIKSLDNRKILESKNYHLYRWFDFFNNMINQTTSSSPVEGLGDVNSYSRLFGLDNNVSEWVLDTYNGSEPVKGNSVTIFQNAGIELYTDDKMELSRDETGRLPYLIIGEDKDGNKIKVQNRLYQIEPWEMSRWISNLHEEKIIRGGSFINTDKTRRHHTNGHTIAADVGFRCVMPKIE